MAMLNVPKSTTSAGKLGAVTAAAFALVLPTAADAGTLWCTTTVSGVAVTPGGYVIPTLDGIGWPYMCHLTTPTATSAGTIATGTCEAWLSMFLTAKTSGQKFSFAIDYGALATPTSCAVITNFSWQVPTVFPYWINFAG